MVQSQCKISEKEQISGEKRHESNQRKELINICKNLLNEKKVGLILAFTDSDIDNQVIPYFVRNLCEVEKIKWDDYCNPNLAKYLLEKQDEKQYKIGIVAKPCDARAIVMYMVEKQIDRGNIYIIGMECNEMKKADGSASPGCSECNVRIPPIFDVLIKGNGETYYPENTQINGIIKSLTKDSAKKISGDSMLNKSIDSVPDSISNTMLDLMPNTQQERLERFQKEIDKCILCFSCRQVCYGCYCPTCFIDRTTPNWLPDDLKSGTKMLYHLGRAMHLAGRCIECGACERVCASGVKIRYLIKEVTDFCKDIYGYTAGLDPDQTPVLAQFSKDDREIGFLGGEEE